MMQSLDGDRVVTAHEGQGELGILTLAEEKGLPSAQVGEIKLH